MSLADLRLDWWAEVFSLTLTLSRWERELAFGFLGCFPQKPEVIGSLRLLRRREAFLPLPAGEGGVRENLKAFIKVNSTENSEEPKLSYFQWNSHGAFPKGHHPQIVVWTLEFCPAFWTALAEHSGDSAFGRIKSPGN